MKALIFLDAFRKLATIFATLGRFEEPYGDGIQHFGVLLESVIISVCLSSMTSGINFATNERIIDHFWMLVGSLRRFSLRLDVLRKRAAISLRCKNEAFNISERYCSRSHYFCFWTACCQGIKDTLSKFVSAVLVDVYNCLCLYRYFSR